MPTRICTSNLLTAFRKLMKDTKVTGRTMNAYIVPSGDSHQNEYIAAADCRREFMSGFSGSAGTAVITQTNAALWVDGRYHIQADEQTDDNWEVMKEGLKDTPTIPEWLSRELTNSENIVGIDPDIVSAATWNSLTKTLKQKDLQLTAVTTNLVDKIWTDRPIQSYNIITVHQIQYSGKTWFDKITDIRKIMKEKSENVTAAVFSALDDVAWLLNLRGTDIPYNPVFFSYVLLNQDTITLYADEGAVTEQVRDHLSSANGESVRIYPYYQFFQHLSELINNTDGRIWVSEQSSERIHSEIPENRRYVTDVSIVQEKKAIKNSAEIDGMKNAHIKDAVSLCEFYSWLEKQVPHNRITESEAADKLLEFKRTQDDFISLSFDTISSTGPDAAIIHYKPIPGEDAVIKNDSIYLCDSGGQYRDGTTDVTRTIHFGTPSAYERECYTRVLKGFINLATAVWPCGTKGFRLEALARAPLWEGGLDYKHGTGHGVGAFLNVHEGPCSISYRPRTGEVDLEAGMIVTDEPGYYEAGQFGIRIENCMLIKEVNTKYNFSNTGYLGMDSLTLVPISTTLIDPNLLTSKEIEWLNSYHSRVRDEISPILQAEGKQTALDWLIRETQPIG